MMNQNVPIRPRSASPWLKVLIGLSLPIVAYCILGIYYNGFADERQCGHEEGFIRKLVCGVYSMYQIHAPFFRSLPSDEEMIENFNKHRADFERLVHIYREDLSVASEVGHLIPTPEIEAVMDRINVVEVYDDGSVWLPPDPYAKEAESRADLWIKAASKDPAARTLSGVRLAYAHGRVIRPKYLVSAWKDYYYVPFVPTIQNRELRIPGGGSDGPARVLPTLDTYPPHFKPLECVYRQISPQWFIRMCLGK
jgi:hypothetical protein